MKKEDGMFIKPDLHRSSRIIEKMEFDSPLRNVVNMVTPGTIVRRRSNDPTEGDNSPASDPADGMEDLFGDIPLSPIRLDGDGDGARQRLFESADEIRRQRGYTLFLIYNGIRFDVAHTLSMVSTWLTMYPENVTFHLGLIDQLLDGIKYGFNDDELIPCVHNPANRFTVPEWFIRYGIRTA